MPARAGCIPSHWMFRHTLYSGTGQTECGFHSTRTPDTHTTLLTVFPACLHTTFPLHLSSLSDIRGKSTYLSPQGKKQESKRQKVVQKVRRLGKFPWLCWSSLSTLRRVVVWVEVKLSLEPPALQIKKREGADRDVYAPHVCVAF